MNREGVAQRWPHISRYLQVAQSGEIEDDYLSWHLANNRVNLPSVEAAAALTEWADFYEFQCARRTAELADDHHERRLVEEWTESMAYCCRRAAARARGEDPGEWVPQWKRRPDLVT
jgi:hypothetical protein